MGLFERIRKKFKAKPPRRQVTTPTRQASSTPAQAQSRSSSDDVLNPFNPVSPLNLMSHDDYAPTRTQARSDSDCGVSTGYGGSSSGYSSSSSDSGGASYSSSDSGSCGGGGCD